MGMFSSQPSMSTSSPAAALNRDVTLQESSSSCLSSFPGSSSGAESSGVMLLLPATDVYMRKKIK